METIIRYVPVLSMKLFLRFIVTCFFFLLVFFDRAGAQTLAVFPLLDLTQDKNGINFVLTNRVRREVEQYNYTLVPPAEIMSFMVRNRIRTLGKINTHTMRLLERENIADLVLLGTVHQLEVKPSATVSLSLKLVRVRDQKVVWAATQDVFEGDLMTLLGLHDPENLNDIYNSLFPLLFQSFPAEIMEAETEENIPLDVHTVMIAPEVAPSGSTIDLRVRLNSIRQVNEKPEVHINVDDQVYPALLDEDEHFVTASWPAQNEEGRYHVYLDISWPAGEHDSVVLGSYRVDNTSPGVRLFVHGKQLNGQIAFNRTLLIVPKLENPEPIKRWVVDVIDENNTLVVRQEGAERFPPRLIWKGKASNGARLADGEYDVVFNVWDMAGNYSFAEETVLLLQSPPDLNLMLSTVEDQLAMNVSNTLPIPLLYWWIRIYYNNGQVVKELDGDTLPVDFSFDISEVAEGDTFQARLVAQDIIGNRTDYIVDDLLAMMSGDELEGSDTESPWLEEF